MFTSARKTGPSNMGPKSLQHTQIESHSSTSAGDFSYSTKKGKDDYPVVVLTNVNFPLWLLGLKTAIRKIKEGGDDLIMS